MMEQSWITPAQPRSRKALAWLMGLAGLLVVVSIGMLLYSAPSFRESDVVLLLEGAPQASSGDQITYTAKWQNNTKVDLTDVRMRLFYPDGSVQDNDGVFSPATNEVLEVGGVSSGKSGEQTFTVYLIGDKGNIKNATIEMAFSAKGLRSVFEKSASVSTTIAELPVPLSLSVPPNAISGQEVSYILDYRNATTDDISDLRFVFTFPDGFTPKRATPAPSEGTNVWDVRTLAQNKGARIAVTGTLSGVERETKTLDIVLQRKVNEQYLDYEKASAATIISSPLLSVQLSIAGARDVVAGVGDRLDYYVRWRNTSNTTLIGLTLGVRLEGDMYNISTLNTQGGFFDGGTQTITWNSAAVPQFSALPPGASGEARFSIALKEQFPSGSFGSRAFSVKASANLITPNVPSGVDGEDITAQDSLTTKISTQPSLGTQVYHTDPSLGASGPFPPQVDQATMYTVRWSVANPGNDIRAVTVSALLPPGVQFLGPAGSGGFGAPVHNANTSTVTWSLASVAQGAGFSGVKPDAAFQVSVTPSLVQRGSAITLLRNISLTATDAFTGQVMTTSSRTLSTDDLVDQPNKGAVQ
ncbi:MAG: hypothetical protein AAB463_02670 [Patescibacteria group bacterium]